MITIKDILRSHAEFDAEGRHVNGTDKQSNHNYGDAYDALFSPITRHETTHVMEIGVADGACLLAWREVFPNALIVGMDIHHSDKAHGERIEFHRGNQISLEDCLRAATNDGLEPDRRFDFICEDATHVLGDTLLTFLYLWPYVRPGGVYVVEEFDGVGTLRTHIREMWPGAEIIDTTGPFGGNEPLVVFRKPA